MASAVVRLTSFMLLCCSCATCLGRPLSGLTLPTPARNSRKKFLTAGDGGYHGPLLVIRPCLPPDIQSFEPCNSHCKKSTTLAKKEAQGRMHLLANNAPSP
eukprot:2424694-Amphidinium_carterae.1